MARSRFVCLLLGYWVGMGGDAWVGGCVVVGEGLGGGGGQS